ncbi:hypothetical protein BJX70DRAFT_269568 [Aspergillus crustosus]
MTASLCKLSFDTNSRALERNKPHPKRPCPHRVDIEMFVDPRQSPPRLQHPKTILRKLLYEHTSMNAEARQLLDRYVPPDDRTEVEEKSEHNTFHKFMDLPRELRWDIWELSMPSRVLDALNIPEPGVRGYDKFMSPVLPVPSIAHVCRETHDVVQRRGIRLAREGALDGWEPEPNRPLPVGFVLPDDLPLYFHGIDNSDPLRQGVVEERGDYQFTNRAKVTTAAALLQERKFSTVAVYWPTEYLTMWPPPSPRSQHWAGNFMVRSKWRFLHGLHHSQTLRVITRREYVSIRLKVVRHSRLNPSNGRDLLDYEKYSVGGPVNIVVDLFDDQQLAELFSLQTLDGLQLEPPDIRWMSMHCVSCERKLWAEYMKPCVEWYWLYGFKEELDHTERRKVFPEGDLVDRNHPWVIKKLAQAPNFRPAVIFNLLPIVESVPIH